MFSIYIEIYIQTGTFYRTLPVDSTRNFDYVFWSGDLNFRLDLTRAEVMKIMVDPAWEEQTGNSRSTRLLLKRKQPKAKVASSLTLTSKNGPSNLANSESQEIASRAMLDAAENASTFEMLLEKDQLLALLKEGIIELLNVAVA